MKTTRLLGGLVFGAIGGLGLTLYATEPHPSELYKQYCAKCHGEDGKAETHQGKKLSARDFTDGKWLAEEKDEELIDAVTNGKDDMPPFGKKLTKDQIEGLVKHDVRGFTKK